MKHPHDPKKDELSDAAVGSLLMAVAFILYWFFLAGVK